MAMQTLTLNKLLLTAGLVTACALLPSALLAQETADEADPPEQSAMLDDLQRQIAQPPPENTEAQALCVHYHRRGLALMRLGRGIEGLADLKQALALNQSNWRTTDDWCSRWRMQNDIAAAYRQVGDPRGRMEFVRSLADELRKANVRRYFFTLTWLMDDQVTLGQLRQAEATLKQAGDLLPELKLRKDWTTEEHSVLGQWTKYSAYLQELYGNFAEAERLRRESLRHARAYLELRTRLNGSEHLILRVASGNVASCLRLLGNNLAAQGRYSEAEVYVRESLSLMLARSSRESPHVARTLGNLGNIRMQQGRLDDAEKLLRQSLSALERGQVRSASPGLAERRADLAFVLMMRDRWPEALALFEARDQGLRSDPAQFARTGSLRSDWALSLIRNGRAAEAAEMMQRIVNHYRRVPYADPQVVARANGIYAVALAAKGDDAQALAVFERALPPLLGQIADDAEGDGLGAGRQFRMTLIFEAYLELLARQQARNQPVSGVTGSSDPVAEAFSIADVARGSAVQRAVVASSARASLPDAELSALARQEQDAGNRRLELGKLLARLASAPEGQRLDGVMADIRREMETLAEKQASLRKTLAARYPDYLRLIDPKPATLAELQGALQPDEAAVAIYIGREQAYVWTLNQRQTAFRTVPLGRQAIERHVRRLRETLTLEDGTLHNFPAADAHALYKALLAPDAALWRGARVLNVIPHGSLGQLPFAVLQTAPSAAKARPEQAPWLIRQVAIAQQASASSFLALRQRQMASSERSDFVGFGDPVFGDQPAASSKGNVRRLRLMTLRGDDNDGIENAFTRLAPLPDTELELREIARSLGADPERTLYLHHRANEQNVKASALDRVRVIAFATHGLIPGELRGLDQPALALANPKLADDAKNDGLLTLDEVLGLRLNADWVVLSACNTGAADGSQGEAVSGLGRGFFFAGARSLLVSNWAVETESARLLTTGVFRAQTAKPALTRAEALQQSMLDLMQQRTAGYAHPAYWAPFSLVGDGYR